MTFRCQVLAFEKSGSCPLCPSKLKIFCQNKKKFFAKNQNCPPEKKFSPEINSCPVEL